MLGHTHMVTPATTHEHRTRTPTVAHVSLLPTGKVGLLVGMHFRHIPFLVASRAHDAARPSVFSGYIRFDRPHISALALAGAAVSTGVGRCLPFTFRVAFTAAAGTVRNSATRHHTRRLGVIRGGHTNPSCTRRPFQAAEVVRLVHGRCWRHGEG